jgi:hypothetical protein
MVDDSFLKQPISKAGYSCGFLAREVIDQSESYLCLACNLCVDVHIFIASLALLIAALCICVGMTHLKMLRSHLVSTHADPRRAPAIAALGT